MLPTDEQTGHRHVVQKESGAVIVSRQPMELADG
jgi:hypothetical protein